MAAPFAPDTVLPCTVAPSPNHGDRRGRAVNALVLHYTGMPTADAALARLRDPLSEVSSHYLVDEEGRVFQLVPEARRAWHAGRSYWQGERDMNSVSVGIEIANAGHDGGLPPFPDAQIAAVIALCGDIAQRYAIAPARVLGHSDIAPGRKVDPGERFPWERLAKAGVGVWPSPVKAPDDGLRLAAGAQGALVSALQHDLGTWGVDAPLGGVLDGATRNAIVAFQQRFRPTLTTGVADGDTRLCLAAVAQLTRAGESAPPGS